MWMHKDTQKALSLKRLLVNPADQQYAVPEPLNLACLVTNGIYEKKYEWLLALERLASEKDTVTLEKKLKALLEQEKPI